MARNPGSVGVSAKTGEGMDDLLNAIGDRLRAETRVVELHVPFDRGDVIAEIHREGEVLGEEVAEGGMRITARLDGPAASRLAAWVPTP